MRLQESLQTAVMGSACLRNKRGSCSVSCWMAWRTATAKGFSTETSVQITSCCLAGEESIMYTSNMPSTQDFGLRVQSLLFHSKVGCM